MISLSTKSSMVSRDSMRVTRTPRAESIEAYSRPMTPAPTTIMLRGIFSRSPRPKSSATMILRPS